MKCEEALDLIQRDLDGDCSSGEIAALRSHLSRCPACSEDSRRLKHLSAELENLPKVEPPRSLVEEILPFLDDSPGESDSHPNMKGPGRILLRRIGWIGGGLAAAALAGVIWFQTVPAGPEPGTLSTARDQKEQAPVMESEQGPESREIRIQSAEDSPETVWSPDQRYLAVVEEDRVVVKNRDGRIRFRSAHWDPESETRVQWRSDRHLTVRIHWPAERNGHKGEIRTIDVQEKEELRESIE